MARNKISQREAVRNRRELRRLREFVERITGYWQSHDQTIVTTRLPTIPQRLKDIAWGADNLVVFVVRGDGEYVSIGAVRVPQEARNV